MAKRKQSSLLTNFGFNSKKLNRDNQNVEEEAGSATAAKVHVGPSSNSASTCSEPEPRPQTVAYYLYDFGLTLEH